MILTGFARLMKWLIDRFGAVELVSFLLLWTALACSASSLTRLEGLRPGLLISVASCCLFTALFLARTRLPGWGYALAGILTGLLGLVLTIGKLGRLVATLYLDLFPLLRQLLLGTWPDFSPLVSAWQALQVALAGIWIRMVNWSSSLPSGQPLQDPMVTSLIWGFLFWLATLWAYWWGRRRGSSLLALIPLVASLSFFIYDSGRTREIVWLVLVVACILLLQAINHYRRLLQSWISRRLDRVEIEPLLALSVVILTLGISLAGGFLPSISLEDVADTIEDILDLEPRVDENAEARPASGAPRPSAPHLIGPGPELTTRIVMYVSVQGYSPPPPSSTAYDIVASRPAAYYWRSHVYDRYTGGGWFALTSSTDEIPAFQPLLSQEQVSSMSGNFELVTQRVRLTRVWDDSVFASGELLHVDEPVTAMRRFNGDVVSAQTTSDTYTATSRRQLASADQLRRSGTDYPSSFRYYLELPEDLPQRVRDLALSLTTGLPTAFDKAVILEAYLRQFPYSLDVPGPPADRDAVDFFLFDLKKGYCDYFASAMVVMARASGIPARLVMGYTTGYYDPLQGQFIVRASNAHAWVEVFFPGYGWVEFEPTSGRSLLPRPGQDSGSIQAVTLPPPGQEVQRRFDWSQVSLDHWLPVGAAVIVFLLLLPLLPFETWWLSSLPPGRALQAILQRLYHRGRAFGLPPDPSRTALEFASALSLRLEEIYGDRKGRARIAACRAYIYDLAGFHNRQLFGELPLGKEEKRSIIAAWKTIRAVLRKVRYAS